MMMRVDLTDDNENWRRWGALVQTWILQPDQRPNSTSALKTQMQNNGITGDVPGDDRPVEFIDYPDGGNLYIPLPSKRMLAEKIAATVHAGPYPLPMFYAVAFGGAAKANLTEDESLAFALRRIGEYTINQCC